MRKFVHPVRPHIAALAENQAPSLSAKTSTEIVVHGNLNVNWITAEMVLHHIQKLQADVSVDLQKAFFESAAYPSQENIARLQNRLAGLYDVDPAHVHMTAGADEAIHMIVELFCESPKDQVIIHNPTYWTYTKSIRRFNGGLVDVPLKEDDFGFSLDAQKIIDLIRSPDHSIKVVNIVNPNNPTGTYFNDHDVTEIIKVAEQEGVCVVVDEAYIEIAGKPSFVTKLDDHPNLIILRTLSKAYGVAGERIGAVISKDPDFMKLLPSISPLFPVSSSAIREALCVTASDLGSTVWESWDVVASQRETLRQAVNDNPSMRGFESHTNFVLIGVENAQAAFDQFLKHGVMPANPALFGFERHLRLSLGKPDDLEYLTTVIERMEL